MMGGLKEKDFFDISLAYKHLLKSQLDLSKGVYTDKLLGRIKSNIYKKREC